MNIVVGTNSWVTLDEANTYFKTRIGSEVIWNEELDDEKREASLITAFNTLMNSGLFSISADSDSAQVKNAQCEMALFLLQHAEDIDSRKGLQSQGVLSSDVVSETYDKDKLNSLAIPQIVLSLLNDSKTEHSTFISEVTRDEEEDI
jgi:hypothetical protein